VDAVSTVNNHCVDRGYEGLVRTLEVLDKYGIAHTGTYPEGYTGDRIHYFTVGDTKVALIAYTYATNYDINKVDIAAEHPGCVNALRPLRGGTSLYKRQPQSFYDTIAYIESLLGRKMIWEETIKLKISMHLPVPVVDNIIAEPELNRYFEYIKADYEEARKNADLVLFYPHVGGQFNEEPGKFSQLFVKKCADLGFDGIFAAHSHTSQRAVMMENKPCFYSMGNVTMSPGTFYSVSECLPEYGLAAHMYINDKRIQKVTFSIFKMVEENGEALRVVPVDDLFAQLEGEKKEMLYAQVASVYQRVTGQPLTDPILRREYDLV
jgi:poly-gamma-glutamate synthesis protein (capsule biosynthesis protein)